MTSNEESTRIGYLTTKIASGENNVDHVGIKACARLLKRDIWLVTSNEESTRIGYLTTKVESGENNVDHVGIKACARLLKRDIWLVTSNEESTRIGYLTTKVESGENNGAELLLLGQLGKMHYCSLGMFVSHLYLFKLDLCKHIIVLLLQIP